MEPGPSFKGAQVNSADQTATYPDSESISALTEAQAGFDQGASPSAQCASTPAASSGAALLYGIPG